METKISIQHHQAIQKMEKFCAYQERCCFDVEQKLIKLGIEKSGIVSILNELKERGYIDDQRFVEIFVRSKFKQSKWGEKKIKNHLINKRIDKSIIEQEIRNLSVEDVQDVIFALAKKKFNSLKNLEILVKKQKVMRFLFSKGFTSEKIFEVLNSRKMDEWISNQTQDI